MNTHTMPLVILGGRAHHSTILPLDGQGKHLLKGYKTVDLRVGDRRLLDVLLERLRATGAFDNIYIAGPRKVYERLNTGARIIDTDSSFGENLAVCARAMIEQEPGRQVLFTTSDILPDPEELECALDDLRQHQPLDFWMPMSRVPTDLQELGESSWKPKYAFIPEGESEPAPLLPGHFLAVNPQIAYVELIHRFFGGLYRTRNRSIGARYLPLFKTVLWKLIFDDFMGLFRLEWPTSTWRVVYHSLVTAKILGQGQATQEELEMRMRRVFILGKHQKRFPQGRGRVPVLTGLSLAKDIDTVEEAQELAGQE
jgi:hypothetical protein